MKYNDYYKIEDCLKNVYDELENLLPIDTSEDEEWSEDFGKILDEIGSLRESMIFTFTIED